MWWKSAHRHEKLKLKQISLELYQGIKRFTPQLIQVGKTEQDSPFYETEYLPILPLNEIFVHGRNPVILGESFRIDLILYE